MLFEPSNEPAAAVAREGAVRLSAKDEADLLEALDEADREVGISAEELFRRLQRFG